MNKCTADLKSDKGITLVEVVAASAIIAIVFVTLISLFTMSAATSAATRERTDMMMAAQDLMEYSCKVERFAGLSQVADGTEKDVSVSINDVYRDRYDAVRTVMQVPDTGGKLLKVVIKVKEKNNADYTSGVSLVTLVADER